MAKAEFPVVFSLTVGSGEPIEIGTLSVPLLLEKDGMTVELKVDGAREMIAAAMEEAAAIIRRKDAEPSE